MTDEELRDAVSRLGSLPDTDERRRMGDALIASLSQHPAPTPRRLRATLRPAIWAGCAAAAVGVGAIALIPRDVPPPTETLPTVPPAATATTPGNDPTTTGATDPPATTNGLLGQIAGHTWLIRDNGVDADTRAVIAAITFGPAETDGSLSFRWSSGCPDAQPNEPTGVVRSNRSGEIYVDADPGIRERVCGAAGSAPAPSAQGWWISAGADTSLLFLAPPTTPPKKGASVISKPGASFYGMVLQRADLVPLLVDVPAPARWNIGGAAPFGVTVDTFGRLMIGLCEFAVVEPGVWSPISARPSPECLPGTFDESSQLLARIVGTGRVTVFEQPGGLLMFDGTTYIRLRQGVAPGNEAGVFTVDSALYDFRPGAYIDVDRFVEVLSSRLGPPTDDSGWLPHDDGGLGCEGGNEHRRLWWGTSTWFLFGRYTAPATSPELVAWGVGDVGPATWSPPPPAVDDKARAIVTEAGMGLGSSLREFRDRHPHLAVGTAADAAPGIADLVAYNPPSLGRFRFVDDRLVGMSGEISIC